MSENQNMTDEELRKLIVDAARLLENSRFALRDPGLAMSWGRQKKAFLNRAYAIEFDFDE